MTQQRHWDGDVLLTLIRHPGDDAPLGIVVDDGMVLRHSPPRTVAGRDDALMGCVGLRVRDVDEAATGCARSSALRGCVGMRLAELNGAPLRSARAAMDEMKDSVAITMVFRPVGDE
eukprot:gene13215-26790_t